MTAKKNTKKSRARTVQHPQRRQKQPPRRFFAAAALAAVLLTVVLGALWLRADNGGRSDAADPGLVHVHGLGLNPANKALYIATHTGLWRLPRGAREPERVGESRQDTMGFTVFGPDRFLGSGHPDNVRQPPLLGLIESTDRGEDWDSISLLGEADFHVLRAVGGYVYGYDVTNARLMVSTDEGRSWTEHRPPPVIDLAPNPTNPTYVVASTEQGLLVSRDSGARWSPLGDGVGLLAWPVPKALYLVTGAGDVLLSDDGGRRWTRVGQIGGQPAALLAATERTLYAAVHQGGIVGSRDGGRTWDAMTS
ncbi:MAG: F510_1955 family glycosylhydrolase [Actinomycetota bacterium]